MIHYHITWDPEINDTVLTNEKEILEGTETETLIENYAWEYVVEAYAGLSSQLGWDAVSYVIEDLGPLDEVFDWVDEPFKAIERIIIDEAKSHIKECLQKPSTTITSSTVS